MDREHQDLQIVRSGLEDFVTDSNEALNFKLVRNESDLNDDSTTFKPEMSHQIYGDNENIFGYRNLNIDLYMTAARLKAFVRSRYDEVADPSRTDGVEPDPIIPPLVKLLAEGQSIENMTDFVKAIEDDATFTPLGEKIDSFTVTGRDNVLRNFEIYLADESIPGFRNYHTYLQPWIMFYIDAASYIDIDDSNWRFFLLFERYMVNGSPRFAIAGFITVYEYYAYPANIRPRISQMLVLPPFQRQGLGAKLLETTCKHYWGNDKVVDLTVEDPSEEFVRLRDFVDVRNCMSLPSFDAAVIKKGFSEAMVKEANVKYKLCKRQVRRVYEILRLFHTNRQSDEEYREYRVDIKKRLNIPFQKEERQLSKLKKVLKPEEFTAATVTITNREQRLESLTSQYKELEEHYVRVCDRLQ